MRKLLIGLAVLAGLLALGWWWNRPQPLPVRLVAVERGPVETLVANTRAGTLKACRTSRLSFEFGGQDCELRIAEGQLVEA
ncbi:MAG: efflux RND transporter periplasmic adaptor subunit, partial [Pseudomonas sp.]